MSIETIFSLGASAAVILTAFFSAIYFIVHHFNARFDSMGTEIGNIKTRLAAGDVKIEFVWDHLRRRALSEGLNKGLVDMNSPIKLTQFSRKYFEYADDLRKALKEFGMNEGKNLNYNGLFTEIDKRFGERIMQEVSKMHGMHYGACLTAAIEIARGDES